MKALPTLPELPAYFGDIRQLAWLVDDLDAAMATLRSDMQIPSFAVTRNASPWQNAFYRGVPVKDVRVDMAWAYVGGMQLELVETKNEVDSLFREVRPPGFSRLHHVAVCVEDFPGVYNRALDNGWNAVVDVGVDGLTRMSYVENTANPELIVEIVQWNSLTRPFFDGIEELVRGVPAGQTFTEFSLGDLTPKAALPGMLAKFLFKKITGQVKATRRS